MICASCRQRVWNEYRKPTDTAEEGETSASQCVFSMTLSTTGEPLAKRRLTEEHENIEDVIGRATSSSLEEKSELSESNVIFDPTNVQEIKKCTNDLLEKLGLNIIDETKFRAKKYQSDLIFDLFKRLNSTLFTQAILPNSGNQILAQLKEKFYDDSSDRNMKI